MASCFDPPVREQLHLAFEADGRLRVEHSVELMKADDGAVGDRIRDAESRILAGDDPWSRRFAAVESRGERFEWHKVEGQLRQVRRTLELEPGVASDGDRGLARLFRDTPLHATYGTDPTTGLAELAIYPGRSDRATAKDRRQVEESFDEWAAAVAGYLEALDALWRYLDQRPGRAELCFAFLFAEELPDGESGFGGEVATEGEPAGDGKLAEPSLTEEEEELLDTTNDAMLGVLSVLAVDEERAESLDEVSRRVFDPFPAPLSASLPVAPVEVEGFVQVGEQYIVPGLSLFGALEELGGQWVWPDPLLAKIEHQRFGGQTPFDVAAFAAAPRRSTPPSSVDEVVNALVGWLQPAEAYRLRWRPTPGADSADGADPELPPGNRE